MKKLFSIGFLLIFLFNTGGYYFVYWGLRNQAKKELIERLDANLYAESETIELTIPVNLPYEINQQDYERVNGDFSYEGKIYRLVKQKFENNTLHIVCIPSHREGMLTNAANDFTKISHDIPATSKQAVVLLAKLPTDYESNHTGELIHLAGWSRLITFSFSSAPSLLKGTHAVIVPPPKTV